MVDDVEFVRFDGLRVHEMWLGTMHEITRGNLLVSLSAIEKKMAEQIITLLARKLFKGDMRNVWEGGYELVIFVFFSCFFSKCLYCVKARNFQCLLTMSIVSI